MSPTALIVVAKAPQAGRAKTRLSPPATSRQAAVIAAASLLDTLSAVGSVSDAVPVIAWTGDIAGAERRGELAAALTGMRVVEQRGEEFGARLAAAHADVARLLPGHPVLQIGMDTPQITDELLEESAGFLHDDRGPDAVLGPAADGGWWALGLRDPRSAAVLGDVAMSCPDTGERTLRALRAAGLRVRLLPELADVDTMEQARGVAGHLPGSCFAAAVHAVTG